MKHTLIALLLFFGLNTFAQEFGSGLQFGFNGCQIDGDKNGGYHKLTGYFGVYVDRQLDDKIGIESGMYYIGKGSQLNINALAGSYQTFSINLHYIEVPFFVTYKTLEKYEVAAGVKMGYLFYDNYYDGGIEYDNYNNVIDIAMDASIRFSYILSDKMSVQTTMNYSMLPIKTSRPMWFSNLIQIGLRRSF